MLTDKEKIEELKKDLKNEREIIKIVSAQRDFYGKLAQDFLAIIKKRLK